MTHAAKLKKVDFFLEKKVQKNTEKFKMEIQSAFSGVSQVSLFMLLILQFIETGNHCLINSPYTIRHQNMPIAGLRMALEPSLTITFRG